MNDAMIFLNEMHLSAYQFIDVIIINFYKRSIFEIPEVDLVIRFLVF